MKNFATIHGPKEAQDPQDPNEIPDVWVARCML